MSFNFESNEADYAAFSGTSCPPLDKVEKDAVHWASIDGSGGTLATAVICTFQDAGGSDNNHLHYFQIRLDKDENWYTGTGTPGSNQIDMWSVQSHEFGHATGRGATAGGKKTDGGDGFGHFLDSASLCNTNATDHHTMCQGQVRGSKYDRSLNTHDKHTFNNAY